MGGSFVIQPTETYPACQYVVKNPATWNPAATSAVDLDGCTTLAVGERVLCPSGTSVGIWIASSATVCVADPTFVVHEGYTVRCVRSAGAPTYIQLSISVAPSFVMLGTVGTVTITNGSLANGDTLATYSQCIEASGGTPPYVFTLVGELPSGLSLHTDTGVIDGTPTAAGYGNFSISVSDALGNSTTRPFTIRIYDYSTKIMDLFGSSIVGWWKGSESSGSVAVDSSASGSNGSYTGVVLGMPGIGDGLTSAQYGSSGAAYANVYTAALAGAVSSNEITLLQWFRPTNESFWTDGKNEDLIQLYQDTGPHYFDFYHAANNTLISRYDGHNIQRVGLSGTNWLQYSVSASATGDRTRLFVQGEFAGQANSIGTWSSGISRACIGNNGSFTANTTFPGFVAHTIILNREISRWEARQAAHLQTSGVWEPKGAVLEPATTLENNWLQEPNVMVDGNPQILTGNGDIFKLWFSMGTTGSLQIGYAESTDCLNWVRYPNNPVITGHTRCGQPYKLGGVYYMPCLAGGVDISVLRSTNGIAWTAHKTHAVVAGAPSAWDAVVHNTCLIVDGSTWYLFYEGSLSSTYAIGVSTSTDGGLSWTKHPNNPIIQHADHGPDTGGNVAGPFVWKSSSGKFYCWCSGAPVNVGGPTDTIRFESDDLITWVQSSPNNAHVRNSPNDGWFTADGQAADVTLCTANGKSYLIYSSYASQDCSMLSASVANMSLDQLVQTHEGIIPQHNPEMIISGSFERFGVSGGADVFYGWTESASDGAVARTIASGEFRSGSSRIAAAKLTAGASADTAISQTVADLVPGALYSLSVWARGDGTNPGRVRVQTSTGTDLLVWPMSLSAPTIYRQITCTFSAPKNGSITVSLYCPSTNGGIAYFDDISLKRIS